MVNLLVCVSLALGCAVTPLVSGDTEGVVKLKSYNVKASETSVSGFSSGAFMAVQFHVSFSSIIRGAGITAGGPFYCSEGHFYSSITACAFIPSLIPLDKLVALTNTYEANSSLIDPTSHLNDSKVFLISGTKDVVVFQGVMKKLDEYYSHFVKSENIGRNFSIPAGHGQLSNVYGSKCGTPIVTPPYVINCNYPAGFMILEHIYGDILYTDNTAMIPDNLLEFNQSEFFSGLPHLVSMDTIGYVYVPTQCQKGAACRLHIAFHGCLQSRGSVGDGFAVHGGYNGVGELNNIIVLYPQAAKSTSNPEGCWDWWGYTGPMYGVKVGLQMAGIKGMLDRIAP